jgi:hypothetical protein
MGDLEKGAAKDERRKTKDERRNAKVVVLFKRKLAHGEPSTQDGKGAFVRTGEWGK